jgi:hypothetical protein
VLSWQGVPRVPLYSYSYSYGYGYGYDKVSHLVTLVHRCCVLLVPLNPLQRASQPQTGTRVLRVS